MPVLGIPVKGSKGPKAAVGQCSESLMSQPVEGSVGQPIARPVGESAVQAVTRLHQEHFASKGDFSSNWFAFVHTPVSTQKALTIKEAKEALEKEWTKLESKKA